MRAQIREFDSPDVCDLPGWIPPEPDCFGFLLTVIAGPADTAGEETFDFVVCTPEWLRRTHGETSNIIARHHLLVFRYDFDSIRATLSSLVASLEGETWDELGAKLARYGK